MNVLVTYSLDSEGNVDQAIIACPELQYVRRFSRSTYKDELVIYVYSALSQFTSMAIVGVDVELFINSLRKEIFKMKKDWPKSANLVWSVKRIDVMQELISLYGDSKKADENFKAVISIPDSWEKFGKDVKADMDILVQTASRLGLL